MRRDSYQEEESSRRDEGMTRTANLATRLAETVGTHSVVAAPEELVNYAVDGLSPAVVVQPSSAAEVVEVVKFALVEKLKVVPFGSGSKCEIGMAPTRYEIAVDMSAMREVAHYDAGDLTLSVDAGMTMRELEAFLKPHGQFLPLAVPCFENATAGGTVASGIDSVLRRQYGTARDFLLGAEFVDGKAELCKSGGRVVKNVTGYDLHKLLIGSLGTLGIITRLNFRTFPMQPVSGGYVANFSRGEEALDYRERLENSGLPLTNLEVIDSETMQIIRAILWRVENRVFSAIEDASWCVYSSFEGSEAVTRRISDELQKLGSDSGAGHREVLEQGADEVLGGMLREAFEWLRYASPATILYRLTICGGIKQAVAELISAAESLGLRSALLVRAGGIIYFALFAEKEEAMLAPAPKIDSVLVPLAQKHSGHATLMHAPLSAKLKITEARPQRGDAVLQSRVKKVFDPSDIFVPGRMVGGI
jgi:glycolate oxidase FAD binding subunit